MTRDESKNSNKKFRYIINGEQYNDKGLIIKTVGTENIFKLLLSDKNFAKE